MVRLIGLANETFVNIEGESYLALIDSGAQLSALPESLVTKLNLKIHKLDTLIEAEASGGSLVPYTGYVEARLSIPGIKGMNHNSLFIVVNDTNYTKRVPVQLGTLHTNEALSLVTGEEYGKLSASWVRANFPPRPISGSTQVSESEFDLETIKGNVKITKQVTLGPFETKHVPGLTECSTHYKRVHVVTEASEKFQHGTVKPICTYSDLKPGSSRVSIGLRNFSCRSVMLRPKTVVAKMSAANIVPFSVAPSLEGEEKEELREQYQEQVDSQTVQNILNQGDNQVLEMEIKLEPLSPEKEKLLFERIDLTGISQWEPAEQEEVRELFKEYGRLFALDDLDLGHTSVVKHKIKLNDYTPFKERYRRIPPHQYDEVRRHLKEMLEMGAIRKSNSPWASAVVLVRKKDGSLRFCIDLCKLNARTIKDVYSLPGIDETLDCLGVSVILTSLDLKSGYWQVEMDEMSKQLTAFTVGPLGYECERMPFGLTNAPATFQRLMESCLGDLHLNWCIIYLDDIIVFSKMPKEHIKRLRGVFSKLVQAGLKLKPRKCEFFKSRISYLGHIVS